MNAYVQSPRPIAVIPHQPQPPAIERRQHVDTIADTIRRAVDSEVPRLVRAADKVQDLIDQLEHELAEHELGAELRAEAAKLEARLAEIRGQIGGKRAAAPTAPARRADTKAIRAWAATHGVECADRGRIPQTVVDAYESRPEQIQGAES